MVNYGINLNKDLYDLAGERGVQIERNYDDEYKDSDRLSEIELRELYKNLKKDIEDLKVKIDKLEEDKERALRRKVLKVNSININNIDSREARNNIINRKKELENCMRELWAINLNYEDLNGDFTPAREYYENNNIKLRDKEDVN